MCGRYTLTSSGEELARHFELLERQGDLDLRPRYNIAPAQDVPVVRVADAGEPDSARGERILTEHRWGLVPSWAKDPAIGNRMINARSETAASKPAFRDAMTTRRCLVPLNGFYEWTRVKQVKRVAGRKQPSWFHPVAGDPPLWAAAGLWERWWDEQGRLLQSCTILTTRANAVVAELHDRMPVLLSPDLYQDWLAPGALAAALLEAIREPWPAERTAARAVSTRVNDARAQGAELLEPRRPFAQGELF